MDIWNALILYWREEHRKAGYVETKTPIMLNRGLWEKSGHWDNYRENMYTSEVDGIEYAIKPMNCPGGMLIYGMKPHSYRDLPVRAAEIGVVHRHELSGVLSGLFRVRAFHQDDAHIFMAPHQIESEILGVLKLAERIYSTFGLGFHLELSTRPEKSIGTDQQWETATEGLRAALEIYGKAYRINKGDGAFYGPKIDAHIRDALGRTWQCGTIQLDMALPERFNLSYIDKDNEKQVREGGAVDTNAIECLKAIVRVAESAMGESEDETKTEEGDAKLDEKDKKPEDKKPGDTKVETKPETKKEPTKK